MQREEKKSYPSTLPGEPVTTDRLNKQRFINIYISYTKGETEG